jgi:hypothetical protein
MNVEIKKTIYSLSNFNNTIDTKFSQLVNFSKDNLINNDASIDKFFNDYDELFYDIPLSGSDETHLGLASRSLEHLGLSIEDLTNEINLLREENIDLKNQIVTMANINTGSLAAS